VIQSACSNTFDPNPSPGPAKLAACKAGKR
jgi:hypothetical protein